MGIISSLLVGLVGLVLLVLFAMGLYWFFYIVLPFLFGSSTKHIACPDELDLNVREDIV